MKLIKLNKNNGKAIGKQAGFPLQDEALPTSTSLDALNQLSSLLQGLKQSDPYNLSTANEIKKSYTDNISSVIDNLYYANFGLPNRDLWVSSKKLKIKLRDIFSEFNYLGGYTYFLASAHKDLSNIGQEVARQTHEYPWPKEDELRERIQNRPKELHQKMTNALPEIDSLISQLITLLNS